MPTPPPETPALAPLTAETIEIWQRNCQDHAARHSADAVNNTLLQVMASHEALRAALARVYADVRALPRPAVIYETINVEQGDYSTCRWCRKEWGPMGSRHPDTDCLWARAHREGTAK